MADDDRTGDADARTGDGTVTCALCGATAGSVPLGWSTSVERGRPLVHCDRCSREHVRSMEAKLDPEHW